MTPVYNIVAYVTAYKDRAALHQCIRSIQKQDYLIQKIVIVDNSPVSIVKGLVPTKEESGPAIIAWLYPNNIGISGGLNKLLQWATSQEYDFVWLFDQDSKPKPDCLRQLIQAYAHLVVRYPIGIVAPTVIDPTTQETINPTCFLKDRFESVEPPEKEQPYECDAPITSGSLLCLNTLTSVPPPDVRLFMDGVDFDYGLRLKQAGYKNFVISQAVMSHRFGYPTEIVVFGRVKVRQAYSALRYYYICRNHTYLELKFSHGLYKLTCVLRRMKFLGSQLFWISMTKNQDKLKKARACLQGTYYGLLGNLNQQFYDDDQTSSEISSISAEKVELAVSTRQGNSDE